MTHYSSKFKQRMVQRMAGSERISASSLSKEVGVSQGTLSRWLREASTVTDMSGGSKTQGREAKSTRQWSADDKLRVVSEANGLSQDDLGAFLRREGLHEATLREWRQVITAALSSPSRSTRKSPEARLVEDLRRELLRKDRALAEVTALLALKKKVQAIWGDEDASTPTPREI